MSLGREGEGGGGRGREGEGGGGRGREGKQVLSLVSSNSYIASILHYYLIRLLAELPIMKLNYALPEAAHWLHC